MPKHYYYESKEFMFDYITLKPSQDFPLHKHDVYELIFLKKGDVSYTVEDKIYKPDKNSLILTPPLINHAVLFNSSTPYERYNILFDERKLNPCVYKKLPAETIIININSYSTISDLFEKMNYYYENFTGDDFNILLMHLVEEIIYNSTLISESQVQNTVYNTNSIIQSAIEYIEKNIHTPLNANNICNELYISKSHLHHLFMRHLKVTPQKYILSKKLSIAQRELRLGRKATNIYTDCGFADYSTFFRAYKKHFGYAPSEEINVSIVRKIYS